MINEFDYTEELQPTVDQEKDRLKKLFETDDVIAVGHSFVYLVNQEIVAKNSLFSKDFDELDYGSLSDDFAEFIGVRTGGNAERLDIRRQISDAGTEFFESLGGVDPHLQGIAGMFMAANEDYVLNHSGERETNGTVDILRNGFLTNQKRMIERLRDRLAAAGQSGGSLLRPSLQSFSRAMELVLMQHDLVKGDSWQSIAEGDLWIKLHEEFTEATHSKSSEELIDLANICMMLYHRRSIAENPVEDDRYIETPRRVGDILTDRGATW